MRVVRIADWSSLASQAVALDCLAHGQPFHTWTWLTSWWQTFHAGQELYLLSVVDDCDTLVGLLPLRRQHCGSHGYVLRFLGGERPLASYPSLLTTREHAQPVATALADFLSAAARGGEDRWDRWDIHGENTADRPLAQLVGLLAEEGHVVSRRCVGSTWPIPLPRTWDDYLRKLSPSHRKQLRRGERRGVQTGRAIVTQPTTREELAQHLQQLLHLHALRQQQRGSVDRFQSPATSQFLHSTVAQLWSQGQAAVYTLAWDGRPAAADLVLLGGETAYAYLAGWDPALAAVSPGNLLQQWIVQDVLRRGCRVLDLLDSAADYGHRWRGKMQPTADIQIQPRVPTGTPGISLSGEAMRAWLKSSLHLNGM